MKLNLLPKSERPAPKRGIRPGFVFVALGILILGGTGGATVLKTMERDAMEREVLSARQYRISLQAQRQVVDELEAAIRQIDQHYEDWQGLQVQAAEGVHGRRLEAIIGQVTGSLWLENTETYGATTYLNGYTRDVALVSRYLYALEAAGFTVMLDSLTSQRPIGLYTFRIRVEGGQQQ